MGVAEQSNIPHPHPTDAAQGPSADGSAPSRPVADLSCCPQFLNRTQDAIIIQISKVTSNG